MTVHGDSSIDHPIRQRHPCSVKQGPANGSLLARLRIHLTYAFRHRRIVRLAEPSLFTELIQYRKLHDRNPAFPRLADKLLAKDAVGALLGPEWVTPTLWHGTALPAAPIWPLPFVLKARHGCNQYAFVRSTDIDWQALRRRTRRWMSDRYGYWLDEWLYTQIERGLLIEPFIGADDVLPIDYKLLVFGGRVAFVQVHLGRETAHRWMLFDRDWRKLTPGPDAPPPPRTLAAMIEAAELLGRAFDFVRADFYEIAGRPRFGEMTFYPGSGLSPIDPPHLDAVMGDLWRDAIGARRSASAHARHQARDLAQ